jgi:methylthioribose-1-phosphate isomerase
MKTIAWEDDRVVLIDQSRLPEETVYLSPADEREMWKCIRDLKVRGAPAIGIAAALGVYMAARRSAANDVLELLAAIDRAAEYLATARPTAVNLFWALRRMRRLAHERAATLPSGSAGVQALKAALLREAQEMIAEDNAVCLAIGYNGLELLRPRMGILTHCNAGGLGTARWGTALAPIFLAQEQGWQPKVFADETRPVLQGARLTAWELQQAGVDVTLICDNMASVVMRNGWVQAVIVGTDRVAANGDVVNKIGTYGVAVLARHHGIPFYVAAPRSSIDLETATGADVIIEERPAAEVTCGFGRRTAPEGVQVYNPAFDVTPAELVTALITEVGIVRPPFAPNLARTVAAPFQPAPEVKARLQE